MSISATNSENQETNQDFVQVTPQLLDSNKQAQARANIGALAKDDVSKLIQHVELNADKNLQLKFADGSVEVVSLSELLLNRLQLKGVVDTYEDLATITNPKANDAYQVMEDSLVYIYTNSGFQTKGKGFNISLIPNGTVAEGVQQAVSGGEVYEAILNSVNGVIEEGNTQAVSGNEVAKKTLLVKDFYTIGGNQFNKDNIVGGYINATTGLIASGTTDQHAMSEIIPIVEGTEFIQISGKTVTSTNGFRFLNSAGDPIKAVYHDGTPHPSYSIATTNGMYYKPEGAVFYQFNVRLSGVGDVSNIKALINGLEYNTLKSGNIENAENSFVSAKEVAEKTVLKSELLETIESINLLDKTRIQRGVYIITSNANISSRVDCAVSHKINIVGGEIYTISGTGDNIRNVVCYDSSDNKLKPLRIDGTEYSSYSIGSGNGTFKTPINATSLHFQISYDEGEYTYDDTAQLNKGDFALPYAPYGSREIIKPEFIDLELSESANIKKININNIDTLLFSGASHVEVNGTIRDKGMVATIGALTDWNVENYSRSGRNFLTTFNSVINDEDRYGVKVSELPGGYVVLILGQNEATYFTTVDGKYLKDNAKACISAFQSRGFKPVISTYFGDNRHPYTSIIREVAEEMKVPFLDMEGAMNGYWNPLFRPFFFSGHTGTRTETLKPHTFLNLSKNFLKSPKRGLKIFRPKNSEETIENLLTYDNYDRLNKYTELSVGHRALKLDYEKYVDRLDKCSYTDLNGQSVSLPIHDSISSEYNQLRRGTSLNFNKKALLSFITEDILASVKEVDLSFETNSEVQVYVRKYIDNSLAISTSGQTAVYTLTAPSSLLNVGDVLTDSLNVNTTFTVISNSNGVVITNPSNDDWNTDGHQTGVLSKSGVNVEYQNLSFGVSAGYYNTALKPKGKWELVNKIDEVYKVGNLDVKSQYDKIEFLIVSSGDFTLKDIELSYEGGVVKNSEMNYSYNSSTLSIGNTSIVNGGYLNNVATDFIFSNTNGSALYDGNYTYVGPNGNTITATQVPALHAGNQILRLKNNDYLRKEITNPTTQYGVTKQILVKIVGRFNPHFNSDENNLTNPITKTTFDYKKLIVEIKRGTFRWQKEIYLPLAFTEHEVKFDINRNSADYEINIISTDDNIELIKADILI